MSLPAFTGSASLSSPKPSLTLSSHSAPLSPSISKAAPSVRVLLSYYRDERGIRGGHSLSALVELLAEVLREAAHVECTINNQCTESEDERTQGRPIPDEWYAWMAQQVRDSDFVLILPTHAYGLRAQFHQTTGVSAAGQTTLTVHSDTLLPFGPVSCLMPVLVLTGSIPSPLLLPCCAVGSARLSSRLSRALAEGCSRSICAAALHRACCSNL